MTNSCNMAVPEPHNHVEAVVRKALHSTPYAPADLTVLSGGTVNFIYRASLRHPLPDGTREVLIKHGEDYIKVNSAVKLTTSRCVRHKPHPYPSSSPHADRARLA